LESQNFTATGSTLTSDYTLPTTAAGAGQITPVTLTASIIGTPIKTYDGTAGATLTSSNYQLSGLIGSDNFTVGQTAGTYNSANVVSASTVTAGLSSANFTAGGATHASDYSLPTSVSGNGKITPATVSVAADDESKFQGQTDPALTYRVATGSLAAGDNLTGSLSRASGDAPGSYVIGQGSLTASSDYVVNFTPGVFTIYVPEIEIPFTPANGANANVFNSPANNSPTNSGPSIGAPSGANLNVSQNAGFDPNTRSGGQGSPVNAPYPDNQSYWGDIRFGDGSTQ
jgi:hypothetical protein